MLDHFRSDVRSAFRRLRTSPGYAAVSILTLGLGIGASTAIFSAVDGVLLKSLPYRDPESLVQMWESSVPRKFDSFPVTPSDLAEWRTQARSFTGFAAARGRRTILTAGTGEPERVPGASVSTNYFQLLGVGTHIGRTFVAADSLPSAEPPVVLAYGFWLRRFGGDTALIGKPITLDGTPFTVVGVLSPNVRTQSQLWTPLVVPPELMADRNAHMLAVIGRIAPGRSIDGARREMAQISARLAESYPESNKDWTVTLVPLLDQIVGKLRPALVALMAAVVFVLLIACANVANLTLARGYARAREVAVRGALGAGRRRIATQMLTENVIVALFGGVAGVAIASLGVTLLRKIAPTNLPRLDDIGVDGRALVFGVAASLVTALVFGVLPALQGSRIDLANALREEGRGSSASTRAKLVQRSLVITQIAFAMVLLTGATLLFRSFVSLADRPLGFVTEEIASGQLTLPRRGYERDVDQIRYANTLLEHLRNEPGVVSAAITGAMPGGPSAGFYLLSIQNVPDPDPTNRPVAYFVPVSTDYFKTLGLKLLAGRTFTESDRAGSQPVTVVDEMFVRQFLGSRDPLTQRVFLAIDDSIPRQIIGVVKTVKQAGIDADDRPTTYLPLEQAPAPDMAVLVRGKTTAPLATLKNQVRAIDPDVPLYDVQTLADRVAVSVGPTRFYTVLATVFAIIAVVLGAIGVYGVLADTVSRRRRELGIRVALGAAPSTLVRDVLMDGARLAIVGVAIGLLASFWTGRALRALLVDVGERDPIALTGAAIIFAAVALIASLGPAARAVRADPIEALRAD
ncbi:MAG TPA: ABC transporter permease [Gemmatimonadaceae bacterium]|nr:ABC transporter permease [Gemmatimonadaceae bacterium]